MIHNQDILDRLKKGNAAYLTAAANPGNVSPEIRKDTTVNGQHPYAIVICCSDSRVVPEAIFSTGIGEIFTIRVAGNVITDSQLGSIQYAAGHLGCKVILVLGHTHCGAVGASLQGGGHGYVKFLTDEIIAAIDGEKDEYKASCINAQKGADKIKAALKDDEESLTPTTDVIAAVYDIEDGHVDWL
ncbi:MAG: carbonic anhydrase [Oscillospiraceae bacterium]|nr:carbonic anhydrase [Oscillospiraceae bacterium]